MNVTHQKLRYIRDGTWACVKHEDDNRFICAKLTNYCSRSPRLCSDMWISSSDCFSLLMPLNVVTFGLLHACTDPITPFCWTGTVMRMNRCNMQLAYGCTHKAHLAIVMVRGWIPRLNICRAANRNVNLTHLKATQQTPAADEEHAKVPLQGLYSEIVHHMEPSCI